MNYKQTKKDIETESMLLSIAKTMEVSPNKFYSEFYNNLDSNTKKRFKNPIQFNTYLKRGRIHPLYKDTTKEGFNKNTELIKKFGLKNDWDKDGIPNFKDCKPFDYREQGFFSSIGKAVSKAVNKAVTSVKKAYTSVDRSVFKGALPSGAPKQSSGSNNMSSSNSSSSISSSNKSSSSSSSSSSGGNSKSSGSSGGGYSYVDTKTGKGYEVDAQGNKKEVIPTTKGFTGKVEQIGKDGKTEKTMFYKDNKTIAKFVQGQDGNTYSATSDGVKKASFTFNKGNTREVVDFDKDKGADVSFYALPNQSENLNKSKEINYNGNANGNIRNDNWVSMGMENRNNSFIGNSDNFKENFQEEQERKKVVKEYLGTRLSKVWDNFSGRREQVEIPEYNYTTYITNSTGSYQRPSTYEEIKTQQSYDNALTLENTTPTKWQNIRMHAGNIFDKINPFDSREQAKRFGDVGATIGGAVSGRADLAIAGGKAIAGDQGLLDWIEPTKRNITAWKTKQILGNDVTEAELNRIKEYGTYAPETLEKLRDTEGLKKAGYYTSLATDVPMEFVQFGAEHPYMTYGLGKGFQYAGSVAPSWVGAGASRVGLNPTTAEIFAKWGVKSGLTFGIPAMEYVKAKAEGYQSDEALAKAVGAYGSIKGIESFFKRIGRYKQYQETLKNVRKKGSVKDYYGKLKQDPHYKDLDKWQRQEIDNWYKANKEKTLEQSFKDYLKESSKYKSYDPKEEKIFLDHVAKTPEEKKIIMELLKENRLYVTGSSASGKKTAGDLDLIARKPVWGEIPIKIGSKTYNIKTPFYDLAMSKPEKIGKKFFEDLARKGINVKGKDDVILKQLQDGTFIIEGIRRTPEITIGQGDKSKLSAKERFNVGKAEKDYAKRLTTERKAKTSVNDKKVEIHTQEWMEAFPKYKGYEYDAETGLYRVKKQEQVLRKLYGGYEDTRGTKDIPDLMRLMKQKEVKLESLYNTELVKGSTPKLRGEIVRTEESLKKDLQKANEVYKNSREIYDPYAIYNPRQAGKTGYYGYKGESYKTIATPYSNYKGDKYQEIKYPEKGKYNKYKTYTNYSTDGYNTYNPYNPYTTRTPKITLIGQKQRRGIMPKSRRDKDAWQPIIFNDDGKYIEGDMFETYQEAVNEGFIATDELPQTKFSVRKIKTSQLALIKKGRSAKNQYKFKLRNGVFSERNKFQADRPREFNYNWDGKMTKKKSFNWLQAINN